MSIEGKSKGHVFTPHLICMQYSCDPGVLSEAFWKGSGYFLIPRENLDKYPIWCNLHSFYAHQDYILSVTELSKQYLERGEFHCKQRSHSNLDFSLVDRFDKELLGTAWGSFLAHPCICKENLLNRIQQSHLTRLQADSWKTVWELWILPVHNNEVLMMKPNHNTAYVNTVNSFSAVEIPSYFKFVNTIWDWEQSFTIALLFPYHLVVGKIIILSLFVYIWGENKFLKHRKFQGEGNSDFSISSTLQVWKKHFWIPRTLSLLVAVCWISENHTG